MNDDKKGAMFTSAGLKFRHELKHFISPGDYAELTARIRPLMKPDPHAGENGKYLVRSLYFDNYEDKALREKLSGCRSREKFRLRFYGGNTDFVKLEKKSKIHGMCTKQNALLTVWECEKLLEGDRTVLKENGHPLCLELYAKMDYQQLRPKNIVEYEREAYLYPCGNVRVTVDSGIGSGNNPARFLSGGRDGFFYTGETVLEVKYDEFLPQIIRDLVQLSNRQGTAFSKYAAGRLALQ